MANENINTQKGHLHPITQVVNEIMDTFVELGYDIELGNEIETEHYNFDLLNVPRDHPARDMQDTFWVKGLKETVMRTHTSAQQGHALEEREPPFKIVIPGKVYRREATDATHDVQFNQIEALVVGRDITLADLKGAMQSFLERLFGKDIKTHLRPGFFPFTEPSVEVDMSCFKCDGKGCPACKQSGWIEILGAGMVHPQVLTNAGLNSDEWKGFAFGVGVDRLAMFKYNIDDVRLLFAGDMRLMNQF